MPQFVKLCDSEPRDTSGYGEAVSFESYDQDLLIMLHVTATDLSEEDTLHVYIDTKDDHLKWTESELFTPINGTTGEKTDLFMLEALKTPIWAKEIRARWSINNEYGHAGFEFSVEVTQI